MNKFAILLLLAVIPFTSSNCLLSPDKEYVTDTLTIAVHDTVTMHDTIKIHDTLKIMVIIHDTLKVHDTTKITVFIHDTLKVHDTSVVYRDTLRLHDTLRITNTVTVHDTITKHDTLRITNTVTVHDTITKHDTLRITNTVTLHDTITKHDTLRITNTVTLRDTIHDTTYLLNASPADAPNLFEVVQYNANDYSNSKEMHVKWCPVANVIGYQVYFSTYVDSGYTKAWGSPFMGNSAAACGTSNYMVQEVAFWSNTSGGKQSGSYFFKVVPILSNGIEGTASNIRAGYFAR